MAKASLFGGGGGIKMPPALANLGQRTAGGILPERGSRAQLDIVSAMLPSLMQNANASGSPILAALAPMIGGAVQTRTQGLYDKAQDARDNAAIDTILNTMGGSTPSTTGSYSTSGGDPRRYAAMEKFGGPTKDAASALEGDDLGAGIAESAESLGMDPLDLATIISYETAGTFDPTKAGPTTQWGQHRGLIQFGEPQAKQHGVDWANPVGSQLGADGAIVRYFRANGWKPGMGMLDAYSIVNAGAPGRYNASDANNGGAPGTVADKVNNQMSSHREKARRLLGGDFTAYAGTGQPQMSRDSMRTLIGLMSDEEISAPLREIAGSMLSGAMKGPDRMSPSDQVNLASSMLDLEGALNPVDRDTMKDRNGVPRYLDTGDEVFPGTEPATTTGDAGVMRQRNEAAALLNAEVLRLEGEALSREEALARIAKDPLFRQQLAILGINPDDLARKEMLDKAAEDAANAGNDAGWLSRIFGRGGSDSSAAPSVSASPTMPKPPSFDSDPLGIR